METLIYYFTFKNASSKQYEVIVKSIKIENGFMNFLSVNPNFPKETNFHSINMGNVNSIDYYDSIVDLVSNIEPESEYKEPIVKNNSWSNVTSFFIILDFVLLFSLLLVLLNK